MPVWVHELYPFCGYFIQVFFLSLSFFLFFFSFRNSILSRHIINIQSEFFGKTDIRVLRVHEIFSVFLYKSYLFLFSFGLSFFLSFFVCAWVHELFPFYGILYKISFVLFPSFYCFFFSQFNSFKIYHKYLYTIWFFFFASRKKKLCVPGFMKYFQSFFY